MGGALRTWGWNMGVEYLGFGAVVDLKKTGGRMTEGGQRGTEYESREFEAFTVGGELQTLGWERV